MKNSAVFISWPSSSWSGRVNFLRSATLSGQFQTSIFDIIAIEKNKLKKWKRLGWSRQTSMSIPLFICKWCNFCKSVLGLTRRLSLRTTSLSISDVNHHFFLELRAPTTSAPTTSGIKITNPLISLSYISIITVKFHTLTEWLMTSKVIVKKIVKNHWQNLAEKNRNASYPERKTIPEQITDHFDIFHVMEIN